MFLCLCEDLESSGLEPSRYSKCSSCKFGAECDEDSEGIWLVIVCVCVCVCACLYDLWGDRFL